MQAVAVWSLLTFLWCLVVRSVIVPEGKFSRRRPLPSARAQFESRQQDIKTAQAQVEARKADLKRAQASLESAKTDVVAATSSRELLNAKEAQLRAEQLSLEELASLWRRVRG